MNKTLSHILGHLLFWAFIFCFVLDYFYEVHEIEKAALFSLAEVLIYALYAYVNIYILMPRVFKKRGFPSYIGAVLAFLILTLIPYHQSGFEKELMGEVTIYSKISYSLNFALIIIISFFYWYFREYRSEKEKSLTLENEKLKMELQMLKTQVSPHFLFNTLNNLYSLTVAKSDAAPEMISKLSEVLRYLLYEGEKERVLVSREVEAIGNYLELQRMRKPAASIIEWSHDGIEAHHQVAPLILIHFVENIFKHGDLQSNKEGYLKINFKVTDHRLFARFENSCRPKASEPGIGWKNVRKQLEMIYDDDYKLEVESEGNRYAVNLEVNV